MTTAEDFSRPEDEGTDRPRRRFQPRSAWIALAAVAVLWVIAAVWGSAKGYYPCYDSGAYVTVSRALLAGEGYVEGNHPEKPPFIVYPPGYVLPLVAGMRVWGDDWRALRIATVIPFGFAALLLIPWAFEKKLRPWQWAPVALVIGLGSFYTYALRIQAEIPYLFWAMLAIGFAGRALAKTRLFTRELLFAIVFTSAALWTKPMGAILPFLFTVQAAFRAHRIFHDACPGERDRFLRSLVPFAKAALIGAVVLAPFAVHLARIQPDVFSPGTSHLLQKNWWDPDAGQRRLLSVENAKHILAGLDDALHYYVPWSFLIRQESDWPEEKNRWIALIGWLVALGLLRTLLRREWDGFDGFVIAQALLICSMPNQHPRYYTVVLPALAVSFFGGLTALAEIVSLFFLGMTAKVRPALAVFFIFAGSSTLLAYDWGDLRGYRDWGEAWSDRSLNVFIARALEKRARTGDILLVDDHYGLHAITGLTAISYHPAQRKSMTGYNTDEYLARGGRLDLVGAQLPEWDMAEEVFTRYGWEAYDLEETEWYKTARLRRASHNSH